MTVGDIRSNEGGVLRVLSEEVKPKTGLETHHFPPEKSPTLALSSPPAPSLSPLWPFCTANILDGLKSSQPRPLQRSWSVRSPAASCTPHIPLPPRRTQTWSAWSPEVSSGSQYVKQGAKDVLRVCGHATGRRNNG